MSGAEPWMCQTCQRVLDLWTDGAVATYRHTPLDPDDHPVVPVPTPADFTGGRCDFCGAEPPAFVVPARDFMDPTHPDRLSRGDWSACVACAELINRNDWTAVHRRFRASWQQASGIPLPTAVAAAVHALHVKLRNNITGPLRPIHTGRDQTP